MQSLVTLPTASSYNIVSGPAGDLWVAVNPTWTTSAIDRIGLNGSVTSIAVPPGGSTINTQVAALTTGPDGNVWFAAYFIDFNPSSPDPTPSDSQVVIGRVTPAGQVTELHRFPCPPEKALG